MRPISHIAAGWGLGLVLIAGGVKALPMIAEKASSQRVETVLQIAAEDFRRYPDREAEIGLAANLQDLLVSSDEPPLIRATADISDITGDSRDLRLQADAQMTQARCLAEAVYYEARSETRRGQVAVADVVMNRVRSKHFPNSICGVVYQGAERVTGCQFSFTCDGSTEREPTGRAWDRAQLVASYRLTQDPKSVVGRSTHYHTTQVNPPWSQTLDRTVQVGTHIFYRFPWRERPVETSVQANSASLRVAPPS